MSNFRLFCQGRIEEYASHAILFVPDALVPHQQHAQLALMLPFRYQTMASSAYNRVLVMTTASTAIQSAMVVVTMLLTVLDVEMTGCSGRVDTFVCQVATAPPIFTFYLPEQLNVLHVTLNATDVPVPQTGTVKHAKIMASQQAMDPEWCARIAVQLDTMAMAPHAFHAVETVEVVMGLLTHNASYANPRIAL